MSKLSTGVAGAAARPSPLPFLLPLSPFFFFAFFPAPSLPAVGEGATLEQSGENTELEGEKHQRMGKEKVDDA